MQVIIFDTETFGKIVSLDSNVENLSDWPKIKQICWRIFDLNGNLLKNENHYFTESELNKQEILKTFVDDFKNSKLGVAHNFLFDFKVIAAELIRHGISGNSLDDIAVYCTMINNVNLCGLTSEYGYKKYPTLTELHKKLFDVTFDGAHDAENDVKATAKCFWNIRQENKIDFENLPNVKNAVQYEGERILEEILLFYGKRKELGEYLYDACNTGIIGHLLDKIRPDANKTIIKTELSLYNVHSNPRIVMNWILEMEKVFLNSSGDKNIFFEYADYRALKETIELLKDRNLYYPRSTGKYHEPFLLWYLSDSKKQNWDKFASMKLYDVIANIISKYEEAEKKMENKKVDLIKDNSGCVLGFLTFLTLGVIKYLA